MRSYEDLENELRASKGQWRLWAMYAMQAVPKGKLAAYGTVAKLARVLRPGLKINGRNVAWLRGQLYVWIREVPREENEDTTERETTLPLHRLATAWDSKAKCDSSNTRADCERLRVQEGSWDLLPPPWWDPTDDELAAIARCRETAG